MSPMKHLVGVAHLDLYQGVRKRQESRQFGRGPRRLEQALACKLAYQCERRKRHDEENGKEDYAAVLEPPASGNFDALQNPVSPHIQENCCKREVEDLHLFF